MDYETRLISCTTTQEASACMRRHYRNLRNAGKQLYWGGKGTQRHKASEAEFLAKVEECRKTMTLSTGTNTMKRDWPLGSYRVDGNSTRQELYVRDHDGKLHIWYCNSKSAGTSGQDEAKGSRARKIACTDIREASGRPVNLIYGCADISVKNCIPRQFYYIDPRYNGRIQDCMSCIDGCSQYPSGFQGDMPTTYGSRVEDGTVKPSAEYPFAFYLRSGHMAIYNELDTHDWMDSPFRESLVPSREKPDAYRNSPSIHHDYHLEPAQDTTLLMRKADINPFREFFTKYYAIKETYPHDSDEYGDAKMVMNACIGMMHQNDYMYRRTSFRLPHLAAVAIARGNQRLLDMAKLIGVDNIAMIVVDSIIYRGDIVFGEPTKALGTFHQEVTGCSYMQLKNSVYMFMDSNGKCVKYKHGSYNRNRDGSPITEPTSFRDMGEWVRVPEGDCQEEQEDGEEE